VPDSGLTAALAKSASEELLTGLAAGTGGVPVQTHAIAGAPADVLIGVAESVGADLIVVGSKGMKGARRIIGSVPNSVAHRSPCHVIIAKTG
ncbi:MAG TPA: universal stress protein, partial [Acidimicrobiales bacterium]|nr:universal stress protein [Acidimicrobiales bacterium]